MAFASRPIRNEPGVCPRTNIGKLLRNAAHDDQLATAAVIARTIALTGCRRGEIINLIWSEVDIDSSCIRLTDSKEGASVRPMGLPAIELLTARRPEHPAGPVFVGTLEGRPLVGLPKHWHKIVAGTPLARVTPHVLRHYLPCRIMSSSSDHDGKYLSNKEIFRRNTRATRHSQIDLQAAQELQQIVVGAEAG
jgi:integrase